MAAVGLPAARVDRGSVAIAALRLMLDYVGAPVVDGGCRDLTVGPDQAELVYPAVREQLAAVWVAFADNTRRDIDQE